MSQRISFKVTGHVQGVCYRAFAVDAAKSLGLTGWVKNSSDGSVTGEAQGDQGKLDDFVGKLEKGPSAARVEGVDRKEIGEKSGEAGFSQK